MPKQHRTGVVLLLLSAIGFLIIGGMFIYLSYVPQHTIVASDEEVRLRGRFDTVGDVLEAANLQLNETDFVWPSLADPPLETGHITIQTASPVELTWDGETETVWTHQTNLASFLAEQGIALKRPSKVRVDDLEATIAKLHQTSVGETVSVTGPTDARIDDGDESFAVQTQASTVGQLLVEQQLDIYAADNVKPALSSWLEPEQHITIERATPVTIVRGGRQLLTHTSQEDVASVPEAIDWLMAKAKQGQTIQRYKGLGEMNPEQLWDTTINPETRRLMQVRIEDAIAADEVFTTLMGDHVEPRRDFIERNALSVSNLDI